MLLSRFLHRCGTQTGSWGPCFADGEWRTPRLLTLERGSVRNNKRQRSELRSERRGQRGQHGKKTGRTKRRKLPRRRERLCRRRQ